ncbi:MAG TPA: NB-ARC domain-containing protein, partial [Actinomycetota bacterium]|nr:NB-ARC domain-containing protein [Actinomycetota bacterium]
MKAARENYRDPKEGKKLSRRELARRLYMSHSNLTDYENGYRLPPGEIVQAYERELKLPPGSLVDLWEQARVELFGEMRTRQRRWVPPVMAIEHSPEVPSPTPEALHQLPRDITGFTGREAELSHLRALLPEDSGGTVVISAIAGTAGVGKTALALHLAHELVPRFPDAQLYVDLHGYDAHQRLTASHVLDRFLRALGVAEKALPADIEEQAALYRGLLRGKRALVLLDNAFSADQVRYLLPASPSCLVLVTSRNRLPGLLAGEGAHLLLVDVLAPQEALQLLAHIAGRERVDAEPKAAAEVVALCGYLPLAVRIAAAKLASRPTMSIRTLADRLRDEQRRLEELAAGDHEVRASFAFSYEELDPSTAQMFRRLGLIPGPDFAPPLAAALIETGPPEAEQLLEALVDAHLVEMAPTPGRYRFHDLLHLYAQERAQIDETESDRNAALQRMLSWYLQGASAADRVLAPGRRGLLRVRKGDRAGSLFSTPAQAGAWLDAEWSNLMVATRQAAGFGLHEIAWQIPDALYGFASLRRRWIDWRDACLVGRVAAGKALDLQAEAWMLTDVGVACRGLRRLDEAIDCL